MKITSVEIDDEPMVVPLVYPTSKPNCNKILFIDNEVAEHQQFFDSAASDVFPIIYSVYSQNEELLRVLSDNFASTGIQRIAFAFHDNIQNGKVFWNGMKFFEASDLDNFTFSKGFQVLCDIITTFKVSNIDFLACNSLQFNSWVQYYTLLSQKTGVTVGASNDKTGNIKYGGDWILESTHEDVKEVYFNSKIDNYTKTLASNVNASGTLLVRENSSVLEYYDTGSSTWTAFSSWPVTIVNIGGGTSVLTVSFTTPISITNTSVYFICGSPYITLEGNGNTVTFTNVANYPGLFQNGLANVGGSNNITVRNFILASTNSSLALQAGWLCRIAFGCAAFNTLISNITSSANLGPNGQNASICGRAFAQGNNVSINSSSAIVENCTNSGDLGSQFGGGILGLRTGQNGGNVIVRNCSNTGVFAVLDSVGGIVGQQAAQRNGAAGNVTIDNCFNTANISINDSSGICAYAAGINGGFVTVTNCYNTGELNNLTNAGIIGHQAGNNGGTVTVSKCYNFGAVNGLAAGGITSSVAGLGKGTVTVSNCYNLGSVNGQFAGGIASEAFGYNTGNQCKIENCYNLGAVTGNSAGGICGPQVAYTDNATIVPNVLLQNCYNLGAVSTNAGGLLGGTEGDVYAATPIVNVVNCYNNGTIVDAGSSFAAISLQITPTYTNSYAADGSWSNAVADATLTGTPSSVANPGTSWANYSNGEAYILSVFTSEIYSPNSGTVGDYYNYTTTPGLYPPGYSYASLGASNSHATTIDSSTGVLTVYNNLTPGTSVANVTAYQGSIPYVYGYNTGSFTVNFVKICFLRGTKILTEAGYKAIEELRRGDKVETYKHGFVPIEEIGFSKTYQNVNEMKSKDKLYVLKKAKFPSLTEDLVITGCHSVLEAAFLNENEYNRTVEVLEGYFKTDELNRIPACVDERTEIFDQEGVHEIWHLALSHENERMNYGVYANGLLVETTSLRMIRQFSGLTLL